ncbi:MAG TPA: cbb3-type cytochrome oxidase assembly protein CcoS [Chitinophagaceae bacterium]|jgi:cbb3-type cytochrome oxidase maturation protein|nr:cbb3-type cytochrome oxidase assembly protein CcoS [Chitinophagaceae bacterium]
MSVLILLLIASLSVSVIFLGAFIWSAKNKQFDDEYASSMRILFEDQPPLPDEKQNVQVSLPPVSTINHTVHASKKLN